MLVTMQCVYTVACGDYRSLPEAIAEAAQMVPLPNRSLRVLDIEVVLPAPGVARDGCAQTPT
jgi:hypothetical protein